MSKRKTTDEERALFQTVIDTPRPLKAKTPKPKIVPFADRGGNGEDEFTATRRKSSATASAPRTCALICMA